MKKTTKILALLMTLLMSVTCFTACFNSNDTGSEPEVKVSDAKDDIEDIVNEFFDTIKKGDIENYEDDLEDYVAPDSKVHEELLEAFDMDELEEGFGNFETAGLTKEDVLDFCAELLDLVKIEIDEIEIDGEEAEVTVTVSTPDFEAVDSVELDESELTKNILEAYMKDKKLTEAEANAKFSSMTQEEIQKELMPYMSEAMKDVMDEMIKAVEKSDITDEEKTVIVENIDGEWLISKLK